MKNFNMKAIEEMLNSVSAEERALILAADDALDRLYEYRLGQRFGVQVECNPGGDRSLIAIDGEVMDMEQFAEWYDRKVFGELREAPADQLPTSMVLEYDQLDDISVDAVKKALRDQTGHYLSGKYPEPDMDWDDDAEIVNVTNIHWGRKR